MSIRDQLSEQIKAAMKARDGDRTTTLRGIVSDIKYALIDAKDEPEDAVANKVLRRLAKQRRESIEAYRTGGREDLAVKEEAELKIVESFLPKEADDAALRQAAQAVIAETGAQGKKDFGKVMKGVMAKFGGAVDGKRVQAVVNELLGG